MLLSSPSSLRYSTPAAAKGNRSRSIGCRVHAYAELTSKGRAVKDHQLVLGSQLGSGSFGEVFKGSYITDRGDEVLPVVLKRVKSKVEGAKEMGEMELLLNAYAAKVARNHCAHFLGHCVVDEDSYSRLTPGLWLMWRYEGSRTMAYYLRRRDTLRALAADMDVPVEACPAVVMKQILQGLVAFHNAGLVHRDVKPLNLILTEDSKRFKFIDLGACADLRSGTNYVPEESILDLNYCPPEQYVLPTDSPHLSKHALRLAISPMLWAQCKPDRFDSWSAGITFLQLCVPSLRTERGLKNFNNSYGPKYDYDLDAWREGSYLPDREFEVLDADGGAGWDLARALLRPRSIKTLPDGSVMFVNDSSVQRISAAEALKHRFMRQARWGSGTESVDDAGSPGGSSSDRSRKAMAADKAAPKHYKYKQQQQQQQQQEAKYGTRPGSDGRRRSKYALQKEQQQRQEEQAEERRQRRKQSGRAISASAFGAAVGLWRNLSNRLFDLEANILTASSATQQQTTTVKKMRQQLNPGTGDSPQLQQEQRKLNKLEMQLLGLQEDFRKTSTAVTNVLGFMGLGGKKGTSEQQQDQQKEEQREEQQQAGRQGSKEESGAGKALWQQLQERLASLTLMRDEQESATEKQTQTVRRMRASVPQGQESPDALRKAESALKEMERRTSELNQAIRTAQDQAQDVMARFGLSPPSGSSQERERQKLLAQQQQQREQQQQQQQQQREQQEQQQQEQQRREQQQREGEQAKRAGAAVWGWMKGVAGRVTGASGASTREAAQPAPQQPQQPQQQTQPQPQQSQQQQQQQQVVQPASAAQLPQVPEVQPKPQPQSAEAEQQQPSEGGNVFLANSLKFTGLAAKVALGMASDATKALKRLEQDSEAKRRARNASQAFRRMLASKQPPLTASTPYAEVVEAFKDDPRYQAVPEEERRAIVASYMDSLSQAQLRAQETAQQRLRDLYFQTATPDARYEDVDPQLSSYRAWQDVPDDSVRQALFAEAVQSLQIEQKSRQDAAFAEEQFAAMLYALDDPPISPASSWPLVKPQVWRDPRYIAVPEPRRREIFHEVHTQVIAAAQSTAAQEQDRTAQRADKLEAVLESARGAEPESAPPSRLFEELRKEQARLRAEYDRMEEKLREMEEQMREREAGAAKASGGAEEDLAPEMPSGTLRLRSSGTAKVGRSSSSKSRVVGMSSSASTASPAGSSRSTNSVSGASSLNGSSVDATAAAAAAGGTGFLGVVAGEGLNEGSLPPSSPAAAHDSTDAASAHAGGPARGVAGMQQQGGGSSGGGGGSEGKGGWLAWLKPSSSQAKAGNEDGLFTLDGAEQGVERGGEQEEEEGEEVDEEGSEQERQLAESLMAIGVSHTVLPDGTIEFSFDRTPSNTMVKHMSGVKRV